MANAPRLTVVRDQTKPRKLGRYELEESLGSADGLETFRARVRGLAGFDRIFAVKCLHRPRGSQVNLNDPYIKTARRLAGINDPRVARVLDADVIDGTSVAVTEFVHGLDLDRFRECAQFAGVLATGSDEAADKWQKIVSYIGAEVAGGLAVMHALTPPLVHAGLSPRNVVATARGGIKILDAGLGYAANPSLDASARRSLAYAAPPVAGAEPDAKADMRALGAVLFELATGELPAQSSTSAVARRALDALWPSMADFIAGLLSEDPGLRPTAGEAAKILADHWADIPDASMVTEMAGLVRNFSAFVADAGIQSTSPPIVQDAKPERKPEAPPSPARAEILSIAPPPPPAAPKPPPLPKQGLAASFEGEPTVVRASASYPAALFQAGPTDPDIAPPADLPAEPIEPLLGELGAPPVHATLMAYPAVEDLPPIGAEARQPQAIEPESSLAGPPEEVTLGELAPAPPSDQIPESADWGAQALAALGDQAGVDLASLAPPPPRAEPAVLTQQLPPPVSDPAIEEAFAFASSEPAADGVPVAESPDQKPLPAEWAEIASQSEAGEGQPGGESLLEDDLVEEAQDGGALVDTSAAVEVEPLPSSPAESPEPATEEPPVFSALAFEEEESPPVERESPRLAHAMAASQEDDNRHLVAESAEGSGEHLGEDDIAEIFADVGKKKRIAVGVAIFALVGGAVAGALAAFGVFSNKHQPPVGANLATAAAKTGVAVRPPLADLKAARPAAIPAPVAQHAAPSPAEGPKAAPSLAKADRVADKPIPVAAPARPAPAVTPTPGTATVSVSLVSKPAGATVWIDGEERGTTPCVVKLAPGSARLTLVHAGYLSRTSTFEAGQGKTIEETLQAVDPPLDGDARFRAECKTHGKLPILVDGRETGVLCPYSKLRVDPGPHSIGLLIPATGKVHSKDITLAAGVRSIVFGD